MKPYLIAIVFVLLVLSLLNRKLNIFKIIKQQFHIYKNDQSKKISVYDIFTFFINPLIISCILIFVIDYSLIVSLSDLIITVLSVISTILFSFLALLIDKKNKNNNKKAMQVSNETYISIIMTIIYSLLALFLTICLILLPEIIWLLKIINVLIYYFILKIILNILMILKRMYLLLDNN